MGYKVEKNSGIHRCHLQLTINPPTLTKVKFFEKFRQVTLACTEITDLGKDNQAIAISHPEEDETKIREIFFYFDQLPLVNLKRENYFR